MERKLAALPRSRPAYASYQADELPLDLSVQSPLHLPPVPLCAMGRGRLAQQRLASLPRSSFPGPIRRPRLGGLLSARTELFFLTVMVVNPMRFTVSTFDARSGERLKKETITKCARPERRLGEIEREMNRIVDSIVVAGMPPERFVARMQELEAEKAIVMAGLESAKESDNVIALHPKALDRYKRAVVALADELKHGSPTEFATIRELVASIIVHASPSRPGGAGTKANAEDNRSVRIDIKGRLAVLCDNPALFPNMAMSGGTLVAGEGLEPPTPGL